MEMLALLEMLRSDYLTAFAAAYHQQLELNNKLHTEIAFEISGEVYKNLYVVDMLKKVDEAITPIEVDPKDAAYSGEVSMQYNGLTVEFSKVSWDSMSFLISPAPAELIGFEIWFDKWIDLEGSRHVEGEIFSRVIHSVILEDTSVHVDLGTATTESAIELFKLFKMNGVKTVRVSSGRDR